MPEQRSGIVPFTAHLRPSAVGTICEGRVSLCRFLVSLVRFATMMCDSALRIEMPLKQARGVARSVPRGRISSEC